MNGRVYRRMALFAVLFGVAGLLIGMLIPIGAADDPIAARVIIVVLGGVIGSSLGVFTAFFARRGRPANAERGVHHVRHLEMDASPQEVWAACADALSAVSESTVSAAEGGRWALSTNTKMDMRTLGDVITCQIALGDDNRQTITVDSRPSIKTTLFDYGRNFENVTRVAEYLTVHGARLAER